MDLDQLAIGEETDALVYEVVYGAKRPKYDRKNWQPLFSDEPGPSMKVTYWRQKDVDQSIPNIISAEDFDKNSEWKIGNKQVREPPNYSGSEAYAMRLFSDEADLSGCGELSYMSESNRAVFGHGAWGCQFGVRSETFWAPYMCLCICKAALERRSRIAAKS